MDRGAWWATVHGVAESWIRLSRLGAVSAAHAVVAAQCWSGCVEIPHIQGQKNPSKMVGTGSAVRTYPTSKGKGEAPARW